MGIITSIFAWNLEHIFFAMSGIQVSRKKLWCRYFWWEQQKYVKNGNFSLKHVFSLNIDYFQTKTNYKVLFADSERGKAVV